MMDSSSNGLPSSAPVPVEDNLEEILMELNKFERNLRESSAAAPASVSDSHITPLLEDYLSSVARTGTAHFPWPKIKPLFRAKLELVIDQFHDFSPADNLPPVPNVDAFSFAACREKVFQQLDCFGGIPFTVQRLCELMVSPRKHYKRSDKFMRALEKNMLVVSTVDPKSSATLQPPPPPQQRRQSSGMANSSASPVLMNGDHRKDERDTDESMTGEPEKKHARLAQPESTPSLSSASAGHLVSDSEEMDVDESPATGTNLSSPVAGRVGEGPCDSRDVDMQLAGEVGSSPKRQRPDAGGTAPLAQNEDDDGPCDSRDASMEEEGSSPSKTQQDASPLPDNSASSKISDKSGKEGGATSEAESRDDEAHLEEQEEGHTVRGDSVPDSEASKDDSGPCDSREVCTANGISDDTSGKAADSEAMWSGAADEAAPAPAEESAEAQSSAGADDGSGDVAAKSVVAAGGDSEEKSAAGTEGDSAAASSTAGEAQ